MDVFKAGDVVGVFGFGEGENRFGKVLVDSNGVYVVKLVSGAVVETDRLSLSEPNEMCLDGNLDFEMLPILLEKARNL